MKTTTRRLVLASLLMILATISPFHASAGETDPKSGFVDVDGGRLYYQEAGQGPTVVFLHDGLLHSGTWDEQIAPWSSHHRVVRYDRRSYGRSPAAWAPYSDLDDLLTLLDALAVDRTTIIGASSGGRLAVDFTLAHPERVEALVLVGAVVGGMEYSTHFTARSLRNDGPLHTGDGVQEAIERRIDDPYLTAASSVAARAHIRDILEANPHHLTDSGSYQQQPNFKTLDRLGEVQVPTLIVVGEADIPDVHAHAGAFETGIEGAKRVVLPDAGHLVHLETPAAFNELVSEFLASPEERARKLIASVERLDIETLLPLFEYDREAPLEVKEVGIEEREQATVVDLSFASPAGGRVPAYLVLPSGEGPHPALVVLERTGDRSTFVDEAVELAGMGLVSLSLTAPRYRPDAPQPKQLFDGELNRRTGIQLVVDLQRSIDLLCSRAEVDDKRIAYLGHGMGASFGAVLAGIESRLTGYVMISGHPSATYSFRRGEHRLYVGFRTLLTPERQARYLERILPFDAVHYFHRSTPAPILLQYSREDTYTPEAFALAFYELAGEPKRIEWPGTWESAQESHRRWLAELLGLN
jgi:pimeloyl-ACP methyl ester carboxylesterase